MNVLKKVFAVLMFLANWHLLTAQVFPVKNYPQGYFAWPVLATKAIVANFGELRPNHYHMGLDVRTEQRQNLPVIAAADGYIAKIKIEPYGFGRCIYINHPNGLTTVYAHLNDFIPSVENFVKQRQYEQESWRIFLEDIPADALPVKKGQLIAYSGNTGGSQGPHLHFEIRDTKTDKVLNPLLFGFPIPDNKPPSILRLAMYDRCTSTYEQTPKFITIKKTVAGYTTVTPLLLANTDKVSFGITAFDTYTGSTNQNGIYESVLYDNEKPVVGFQLDSISYDETRYLNAHVDYKLKSSGGPWVQHLSRLPGYPPSVYKDVHGDGVIHLEDDSVHHIRIEVKDANGNLAELKFAVQRGAAAAKAAYNDSSALYQSKVFHPGFVNVFENDKVSFFLAENQLYDSIRFKYTPLTSAKGPAYQLHPGYVPVHSYFDIKIKAPETNINKVIHHYWNNKHDYEKAVYDNGWYKAAFRAFGNFELIDDTIPPTITPVGFKNGMNAAKLKRLVFVIRDVTDELRNFRAELDGKWLRFSNDKGKTFIYVFDEHCPPGQHHLKISVEDVAGNKVEKEYEFLN